MSYVKKLRTQKLAVIQVPAWVPAHLTDFYLNVAERDGEEAAASACRRLKNGKSVSASRLPAVVSPAGC